MILSELQGARERFVAGQDKNPELTREQIQRACKNFESELIEEAVVEYAKDHKLAWIPHPDEGFEPMAVDASADTFIDTDRNSVSRFEVTASDPELNRQSELDMSYSINSDGRIIVQIVAKSGDTYENPLSEFEHPALETIRLPDGQSINSSDTDIFEYIQELDPAQAKVFVDLLKFIVDRLRKEYQNPKWMLFVDTELTSRGVEADDPSVVYKIESLL